MYDRPCSAAASCEVDRRVAEGDQNVSLMVPFWNVVGSAVAAGAQVDQAARIVHVAGHRDVQALRLIDVRYLVRAVAHRSHSICNPRLGRPGGWSPTRIDPEMERGLLRRIERSVSPSS
jgi:hypothetical protein